MPGNLNPLAARVARTLTRTHPEFAANERILREGDVELYIEAPPDSNAGALVVSTARGEDIWIRFAAPQMSYSVDNQDELITIVDALLDDRALFVRIVDSCDQWVATTLVARSQPVDLETGQRATTLSWSGCFDGQHAADTPTPSWIEFHDSQLIDVHAVDEGVEVLLSAYVHAWDVAGDGRRGTGWNQSVRIRLTNAVASAVEDALPLRISNGHMTVGGEIHRNLVPLPFTATERTTLRLELPRGMLFEAVGASVALEATGSARYIEPLPADLWPGPN